MTRRERTWGGSGRLPLRSARECVEWFVQCCDRVAKREAVFGWLRSAIGWNHLFESGLPEVASVPSLAPACLMDQATLGLPGLNRVSRLPVEE